MALVRALILAKSSDARYLPGWCGPHAMDLAVMHLRDPRRRPYMRNGGYVTSRPANAAPIAGRC
jgi:hypothetical protein